MRALPSPGPRLPCPPSVMSPSPDVSPLPSAAETQRLRRALEALAAWQVSLSPETLPVLDEAALHAELDAFAALSQGAHGGAPWADAEHRGWQRARQALLAGALAQPRVPLHGGCTLDDFDATGAPLAARFDTPRLGPLTWDLAHLLRDPRRPLKEADELDPAIRYWQALRRSDLALDEPWDSDFGEFWRACEWIALLQHLGRIGRLLTMQGADRDTLAPLLGWGMRVAMRYRPLQPIAALLEPWTGARLAQGFTF